MGQTHPRTVSTESPSFTMDPEYSLRDVVHVQCHLCETPVPPLHCVICNKHLCEDCEGDHLSDKSKQHKVVPFNNWESFPKCQKHSTKICDHYCEQCNIPICSLCVSSIEHQTHDVVDILESFKNKKHILPKDLQDFENIIHPKYKEIASSIPVQKADLNENSKQLTKVINRHEDDLHREISIMIQKLRYNLDEMDCKHMALLIKQEDEIKYTIFKIKQCIADLIKLQESNDVSLVSAYKSRNADFRKLPPKHTVFLSNFTPQKINEEQLCQQFGSLSVSSMKTEEYGYTIDSPLDRSLITVPKIITEINTEYGGFLNGLRRVTCSSNEDIWTCGQGNKIRIYNLQGELVKSIQTKSGHTPCDIALTRRGHLVYTDYIDRTVNIVKNTQIQTVIRLRWARPLGVSSTSSGELLVVMVSGDNKQTRVVRYSGSTAKQSIQFNDKGQHLYSSGHCKYISENRNLDICVSDPGAHAVVVVNQTGKLRFTYTGHSSTAKRLFSPVGITTDSRSRILTADTNNDCIHNLEQDGQFLRYIDNCHLQYPWGLCMDTRDNLFVTELNTGKVKL